MSADGSAMPASETLKDIQSTLGSVPDFLKLFPEEALPGAWETMKNLELSGTTAVPPKYKELIGLGVAAQIPCKYCVYFHTEAAKLNGATDREIREAVAEASMTRFWSTVLNGVGQDPAAFREEIERGLAHLQSMGDKQPPQIEITDAQSAFQDMEANFGFVPTFMKALPVGVVAAAWREMKQFDMNPATAIPNKYKDLLSVGVASQIPCQYCVYADKEFAKADGATEQELNEAIGMAGITRQWSTFLNGLDLNQTTFRKQVDAVMQHAKGGMASAK